MEKLELKEIVGYLPYGLNCQYDLSNIADNYKPEIRNKIMTASSFEFCFLYCKPILRPLSDLTKDILLPSTVNWSQVLEDFKINNNADFLPYHIVKKLYEWHFDIHNLISRGLAIDINTL